MKYLNLQQCEAPWETHFCDQPKSTKAQFFFCNCRDLKHPDTKDKIKWFIFFKDPASCVSWLFPHFKSLSKK